MISVFPVIGWVYPVIDVADASHLFMMLLNDVPVGHTGVISHLPVVVLKL
jgi:hypothetical protein